MTNQDLVQNAKEFTQEMIDMNINAGVNVKDSKWIYSLLQNFDINFPNLSTQEMDKIYYQGIRPVLVKNNIL